MTRRRFHTLCAGAAALSATPPAEINRRNEAYGNELEQYFRNYLVEQYPARAARAWRRSYTGVPAFLRSVEPNRARYRAIFSPPSFDRTGPAERKPSAAVPGTEWITVPLGLLKAEALLAFPARTTKPAPLVIAQHGIGSFPERVF